ncbi:run domain Beclin-1-interacting and cysteine-rich domain-containing protein-like [Teleopsis dalmanni]|uniref:run domain Beclin-1-interacting and cysteine-rich domain-containing protein-like n=1 Tax=Teleopsis dalmanni TaxID=139649 RepID=UPI0018CFB90A|nr:run domain Beclin-1-interacting and cysteine-rich domain-containing protein-like [Teleopsis dalmanni]
MLQENSTLKDVEEHIPYAEVGENCLDLLSAEVVGLSLISKFNDVQLPKVSELKWLVSDQDTPQKLLPLPSQKTPMTQEESLVRSRTRGNKFWAPPRPQIIFTDQPQPNRKQQIKIQNNLCAGCGMHVAQSYIHSFRYCSYFGKYHCTGCHRNQISTIPAKILQLWDFKCYPVSVFAYRLLEQMYSYPLFYVPDINPALYIQNKILRNARKKRFQLGFVKDFIRACRFAVEENKYFDAIPNHIASELDVWSMADFIDVENKSMKRSIDELISNCEAHIFNCVLCIGRGFICEYCDKSEVIYPWQKNTFRCDRCGSCFHLQCWKGMVEQCCKCHRMNKRRNENT